MENDDDELTKYQVILNAYQAGQGNHINDNAFKNNNMTELL